MTREKLEARLTNLREQYRKHEADAIAVNGAIQDCEWWLKELEKEASNG